MPAFDVLLLGGRIVDGTGSASHPGDVGIMGDRIVAVGDLPHGTRAHDVVDVEGLVVAPGFIDMHSHSDVAILARPSNEAKTRQGITTEVVGQDGMSVAPYDAAHAAWRQTLLGLTGHPEQPWTWRSFNDYLNAVDRAHPATNVVALLGYATVRHEVLGMTDRAPDAAELQRMAALVEDAMDAGAYGMSVGLVYLPAVFARRDELVALFRIVGRHRGLMVIHLRSQGDQLIEGIDEAIAIAREAQVDLHISHLCALGPRNWPKLEPALQRITFDQHPYTAGSTLLSQVLPPWATEGGVEAMAARLTDPKTRERIRDEITGPGQLGWENYAGLVGWDGIQVAGVVREANRLALGQTIGALARVRQQDPIDVVRDLLVDDGGGVGMVIVGLYSDESIGRILRMPGGSIGTDGVIGAHPHPRLYGSTARVLERYVRGRGELSVEEAVARLSFAGSDALRLGDRGRLTPGSTADIVVFDPEEVRDRATYEAPHQHPAGIVHVLVNGQFVVRDGRETGARPGRVLRRRHPGDPMAPGSLSRATDLHIPRDVGPDRLFPIPVDLVRDDSEAAASHR